MSYLVIVESPSKAKTIGKYLGPNYKVKASMGHLRDLPKSELGIDIENNFAPKYVQIKGKADLINELRKEAEKSDDVFLATDPDREGEAISWHLSELLGLGAKAKRVKFNEITERVIKQNIANPHPIDHDLVDAQQARRVLDRIVGYKISPLLWRKMRKGLSAGRVQSVCVRLIVERELEIRAFVSEEYWTIEAKLGRGDQTLTAKFYGDPSGKVELKDSDAAEKIISAVRDGEWKVTDIRSTDKKRQPAPPFTTSTLQQEASRKLSMTPQRTMAIAQSLYEGVDVEGIGTVGLITYMRTDSLRISDEALVSVRDFISNRYGNNYRPDKARIFKMKGNAQDAHEAIRPTDVNLTPDRVRASLTPEQSKLYKLIWDRFVASQMSAAELEAVSIDINASNYLFRTGCTVVKFNGFTALYEEGRDVDDDEQTVSLPDLKIGEILDLQSIEPSQHFTQPPARYTYATLIKAMEELGVGRPSTYAPTIATILDREYCVRESKNLRPTPLGEVVNQLLVDRFSDIVDVKFTAKMEDELDSIEEGREPWQNIISRFYDKFAADLANAEEALKNEHLKVPDEVTDVICELCGRNMVIKSGRFGKFLACPGYPECKNTKPITEETPGICPKCGGKILKKKSKNGYKYFGCEHFPNCDFMTWDTPVAQQCDACGMPMFRGGIGYRKNYCANPKCAEFMSEEVRQAAREEALAKRAAKAEAAEKKAAEKAEKTEKTGKKTVKKTAAKKTTKKTTAKKTATKKTAKSTKKATSAKTKKTAEATDNE